MDMTSFIKTNNNNNNGIKSKSIIMNSNGHISIKNNNQESSPSNIKKLNENSHKYTNASMDSINAVERELDEVLKDLELNSQDLTDQLNENVYQTNSIELPINIQKGNRWENGFSKKVANMPGSEFINLAQNDIFINENYDLKNQIITPGSSKSNTTTGNNNNNNNNNSIKRQNIISTYELCHDCFENSGIMQSNGEHVASCQHHNSGAQQAKMVLPKKVVLPVNRDG